MLWIFLPYSGIVSFSFCVLYCINFIIVFCINRFSLYVTSVLANHLLRERIHSSSCLTYISFLTEAHRAEICCTLIRQLAPCDIQSLYLLCFSFFENKQCRHRLGGNLWALR